jgi:hypothetical protein
MHDQIPFADKVYDTLRYSSTAPIENELRFTNFVRKATSVLLHTCDVVAQTAFKPGFRTEALVKNLTHYQDLGREDYEAYCARLADAYKPKEPRINKVEEAEIFALMDGVISFHYTANMAERMDTHIDRFKPSMKQNMMTQLHDKQNIVSYYHEPDFNDTPYRDLIDQQPHIQNYLYMRENLHDTFTQFQKQHKPYFGTHNMNGLISSLLLERAYHQAKNTQFKLHFDTDASIITASGPLFINHMASFKNSGLIVTEHTTPLASTTPHPVQNKLWSHLAEQPYYTIS